MTARDILNQLQHGSVDEAVAAAELLEHMSRREPGELWVHRETLFQLVRDCKQPGIQWYVAETVSRLPWSDSDAASLIYWFGDWITVSTSVIVKVEALSAICVLALNHTDYMPVAKRYLARALKFGSEAERARARKLIGRVEPSEH